MNAWNQRDASTRYFLCPSAPFGPRSGTDWSNHWFQSASYGLNTAVLGAHAGTGSNQGGFPNSTKGLGGWPGYGVGISGYMDNARLISRIRRPGMTILLAEHRGAHHALAGGADNPYAYWTDPPSFRQPVDGDLAPVPAPADWTWSAGAPWNDALGHSLSLRVSHRGESNYLFHDGRVGSYTPWETGAADAAIPNMWTGN